MLNFTVSTLPITDVITDLAKAMDATLKIECRFYKLLIPAEYGKGQVDGIDFGHGFGMLNYDCTFNEDVEIFFSSDEAHPLKFLHCYEGRLLHHFQHREDDVHELLQYGNMIAASELLGGHIIRFQAGQRVRICSLEVDREQFVKLFGCEVVEEPKEVSDIISDHKAETTFFYNGNYSIRSSEIIYEVMEYERTTFLKTVYAQGKCYELLALQWMQYMDDLSGKHDVVRQIQVKKFDEVIDYVGSNLANDLNVSDLSQKFSISERELQSIFRAFSGTTANDHIQKLRLEEAVILIEESDKNISEIVYSIGLNSRSYFAKLFKDSYGLSPSLYRKRHKEHHLRLSPGDKEKS